MKKYTAVDLFSGCGGLSRGFQDAGFDVVLGIDYDDDALKTFKENHKNSEVMKLDLFDHSNLQQICDYLREHKIELDVLVGGPPCQGFSIAGPRDENDRRNSLYLRVNDGISSRMIIEAPDAQYLQKHGDMIYKNGDVVERAQGYLIEIPELDEIVRDVINGKY